MDGTRACDMCRAGMERTSRVQNEHGRYVPKAFHLWDSGVDDEDGQRMFLAVECVAAGVA